jgi:hypothetical protein
LCCCKVVTLLPQTVEIIAALCFVAASNGLT